MNERQARPPIVAPVHVVDEARAVLQPDCRTHETPGPVRFLLGADVIRHVREKLKAETSHHDGAEDPGAKEIVRYGATWNIPPSCARSHFGPRPGIQPQCKWSRAGLSRPGRHGSAAGAFPE